MLAGGQGVIKGGVVGKPRRLEISRNAFIRNTIDPRRTSKPGIVASQPMKPGRTQNTAGAASIVQSSAALAGGGGSQLQTASPPLVEGPKAADATVAGKPAERAETATIGSGQNGRGGRESTPGRAAGDPSNDSADEDDADLAEWAAP
ncbi:hypothetical protein HK405_000015 [Cladochytrium tenue]|nr:hypothetical protein HK405_000015 [Cladochytrium tenue]